MDDGRGWVAGAALLGLGVCAVRGMAAGSAARGDRFGFVGACPEMTAEIIHFITDSHRSRAISYATFAKHVDLQPLRADDHPAMYRISAPSNWAISFHRSTLPSGKAVFYFDWSHMEHLFVEDPDTFDREEETRIVEEAEARAQRGSRVRLGPLFPALEKPVAKTAKLGRAKGEYRRFVLATLPKYRSMGYNSKSAMRAVAEEWRKRQGSLVRLGPLFPVSEQQAPPSPFRRDDSASIAGTYGIGWLVASYADLKAAFGAANDVKSSDGKVTTIWIFRGPDNTIFHLYDYKATREYAGDKNAPTVAQFRKLPSYQWHVGGREGGAAKGKDFTDWVEAQIAKLSAKRRR